MPESIKTLCVLIAVASSFVGNAHRRGAEHRAAQESSEAISGFVGFYYSHEVRSRGLRFPALKKDTAPLPAWVYRLMPPEYLHDIVAAEVTLPDETVAELLPLSRLSQLKTLSVTWPRYSDAELTDLKQFQNLEQLNLSYTTHLTDEGIQKLAVLKNLKVLRISGDEITDYGVEMLRRKMPNCVINGQTATRETTRSNE